MEENINDLSHSEDTNSSVNELTTYSQLTTRACWETASTTSESSTKEAKQPKKASLLSIFRLSKNRSQTSSRLKTIQFKNAEALSGSLLVSKRKHFPSAISLIDLSNLLRVCDLVQNPCLETTVKCVNNNCTTITPRKEKMTMSPLISKSC